MSKLSCDKYISFKYCNSFRYTRSPQSQKQQNRKLTTQHTVNIDTNENIQENKNMRKRTFIGCLFKFNIHNDNYHKLKY